MEQQALPDLPLGNGHLQGGYDGRRMVSISLLKAQPMTFRS
jgi:hypothetical protein